MEPTPERAENQPASVYYKHTGGSKIASRFSTNARKRMFRIFTERFSPYPSMKVLDVGVTSDRGNIESNYFEQFYPFKDQITCVGTEDAAWLEDEYPGLRFQRIEPHTRLPFEDSYFDVAFSNAVIEHVGNSVSQSDFISELLRVSKGIFITTPNRWFPIETHTMLPLIHYLPATCWRACLRLLGYEYYSHESNLHLLDKRGLMELFAIKEQIELIEIKTLGFVSNLVAVTKPEYISS